MAGVGYMVRACARLGPMTLVRVSICIADGDAPAPTLLVALVYSDIVGNGLPYRLAAGDEPQ